MPAVDADRRGGLFVYFLAYISSGMGLLLATSFLNLRRDLRQRKLKMPGAMTATWLSTGAVVIIGLTVLAAALPLPGTGWSVVRGSTPGSSDARASRFAVLKDDGAKGEGAGGEKNDPNAKQQTSGKGKGGGKNGPGNAKNGAPRGKSSKSGNGPQEGIAQTRSVRRSKGPRGPIRQEIERDQDNDQNKSQDEKNGPEQNDDKSQENQNPNDSTNPPPKLPSMPFEAPWWLRGLFVVVGAGAFLYGLFRYGPLLLDAFRAPLAAPLGGFGFQKPKKRVKDVDAQPAEPAVPPRPFSSFPDPFASGMDRNFSPNDLIIYSFEALEAWAFEHNLARSPHETPTEFVGRLGEARVDLRQDAARPGRLLRHDCLRPKSLQNGGAAAAGQVWRALQGFSA